MINIRSLSSTRPRWYLVAGILSLIAMFALKEAMQIPSVREFAQLFDFYLELPGWTLVITSTSTLFESESGIFAWLTITGFSWFVWFLCVVVLIEVSRQLLLYTRQRFEPGGRKRFYSALAIIVTILILVLLPYPSTVVPQWKIIVTDLSGQLIPNAHVRQTWQHYGLEQEDHEEDRRTEHDGSVTFPSRVVYASLISRLVKPMMKVAKNWIHASVEPHAYVMAWHAQSEGDLDYDPAQHQVGKLILRPRQ